jgi:6-phosphogluconolactonase
MNREIIIHDSADTLVASAVQRTTAAIHEVLEARGSCSIILSGGSTPAAVYAALAHEPVDWSHVHLLWGDERVVPPDHADSNFRMTQETLLDHIDIPAGNVHRIRGELDPVDTAREYQRHVVRACGDPPRPDIVYLGMGNDGHTASLFPGTTALDMNSLVATEVYVPKFDAWRVTLTLPVLNNARNTFFLVKGTDKADMLARVISTREPDHALPSTLIRPERGMVAWLIDRDAAGDLPATLDTTSYNTE